MLTEKYRPKSWGDVIGQDEVTARLAYWENVDQLRGRAYWISGKSGTGKTTIARIMAGALSDQWHTDEMDSSELTMGTLKTIKEDLRFSPMTCASRVFIVNEAHGLSKAPVRMLLQLLEEPWLSPAVTWIFTTTLDGQVEFEDAHIDSGPLLSRCVPLKLAERGLCRPMAERCREIAGAEGLNGLGIESYERLLKEKRNNMRAALQAIEAGAMGKG
jgi:replication-associated recombination protein RarA